MGRIILLALLLVCAMPSIPAYAAGGSCKRSEKVENSPMSNKDFRRLRRSVEDASFDADKFVMIRAAAATSNFSEKQCLKLMDGFDFDDDKNANKLIKKALSMDIHFSPQNISDLLLIIDDTTIRQMIKSLEGDFTQEWLDDIALNIDSTTYDELEERVPKIEQDYDAKNEGRYATRQPTEGDITLTYINDALDSYLHVSASHKKIKTRSKPKAISALFTLRKISRVSKKIFSLPPTTKQKIARQRAKRRRNRPWWDK